MLVRAIAAFAVVLFVGTGPSAFAAESIHLAQASPAPGQPDVSGDLPSATWLLVVVALGLAAYVSYRFGQAPKTESRRREGPISRALSGSEGRATRDRP